jgi:hypothetical protein
MRFSPRLLTSFVLLVLTLSFLAVNVHAASHYSSGKVYCELCAGFTDPPDAATACDLLFSAIPGGFIHLTEQFATLSLQSNETPRARGPPARNQMNQ